MIKTFKFEIGNNKKVTDVKYIVENNYLIVEADVEDDFDPKDGDFCKSSNGLVFIYNGLKANGYLGAYVSENIDGGITYKEHQVFKYNGCKYATDDEILLFLEKIERETKLRWNSLTNKLEKYKWRANIGDAYYSFDIYSGLTHMNIESDSIFDKTMYSIGNYFKTPEMANKAMEKVINFLVKETDFDDE